MSHAMMVVLLGAAASLLVLGALVLIALRMVASVSDKQLERLEREHESKGLSETTEKAGHDDFEQID